MSILGPSFRLGFALAIILASTACDGCRRDHPFTPFVVTSATTAASVQVSRPPPASSSEVFPAVGEKLSQNSRQFSLGARQADAPESMTIDSVLRADWNDDGKIDGLSLLRASPGQARAVGAIYLYDGAGDARKLLDLPGWIPSSQDCSWESRLMRVGKHTATVDLNVHCNTPMPPRTPTRFLTVVSPTRSEPQVIAWRLAESAPGETYKATVSVADRDGDNTEDVCLTLELGLTSGKDSVRSEFTWLDRAAGVSREPGHFAASLGSVLATLEKKATSRKSAPEAIFGAGLVWRLLSSSCAESSTARIFGNDGSPIGCESLDSIVQRLTAIKAHAALVQNDVLSAAFALSESQGAFGTSLPVPERSRIVKSIRKASTSRESIEVTSTDVRPVPTRTSPHYSPLQFQSNGTLLAMTHRGVLRIQSDGREASPNDDAGTLSSWPLTVSSNDGRSWENLVPSCDRSEITLMSKGQAGNLLAPELTNLLAPRPGLCAGATSLNWHLSPIRFDEGKPPLALLEGACLTSDVTNPCLKPIQLGKPQPGSPVSPDGHWLVAATEMGLFIIGGTKPELWESTALGKPATLSDCVIANGGERIACLRASRVWLFAKSLPPAVENPTATGQP